MAKLGVVTFLSSDNPSTNAHENKLAALLEENADLHPPPPPFFFGIRLDVKKVIAKVVV